MITKTLLTSKLCGPCMVLKSKLSKLEYLVYDIKDFTIKEDQPFFIKHNIKSVPRLVIEDGDNVEIIQGSDDIIKAIQDR